MPALSLAARAPLGVGRRLVVRHLIDRLEERLDGIEELGEPRALAKALEVALDGVPLDSHHVALGMLDAA